LAHEDERPICIHIAETLCEIEFLQKGTGKIRNFREEFGMPPQWVPPGMSPVRYLNHLGLFERPATLIHGNYVPEEDFDIIALSDSSIVFCPRSHRYFGHKEHPFLKMLENGINVALGTDSLISSPTLSVLDEMKFIRKEYPNLKSNIILKMATINGLKALSLPEDIGPFAPGCQADFVGVTVPENETNELDSPLSMIISEESEVIFSMAAGKILVDARP
jgi:cytosine/adenosine deaminase-related metal-dependent hydrolase